MIIWLLITPAGQPWGGVTDDTLVDQHVKIEMIGSKLAVAIAMSGNILMGKQDCYGNIILKGCIFSASGCKQVMNS